MRPSKDEILKDIDETLKLTAHPDEKLERLWEIGSRLDACLRRHTVPGDAYDEQAYIARQWMQNKGHEPDAIRGYRGVLQALRADVEAGHAKGRPPIWPDDYPPTCNCDPPSHTAEQIVADASFHARTCPEHPERRSR